MIERAVALAVLVASAVYLLNAWPLAQGTMARPGAGLFPRAVGMFATAVALGWVVSALYRAPAAAGGPVWSAGGRGRVAAAAGLLAGFCVLLPWAGYPVAAFFFVGLLLRTLGAGWTAALAIGVASAAVSYGVFALLLGVPLPQGILLD